MATTSSLKEYGKYAAAVAIGAALVGLVWSWSSGPAPAPAPIAAAPAQPAPEPIVPMRPVCLPGYVFYPDEGLCTKMLDKPVEAVRDAGCKPGEKREVPDPASPGHTLYQVCGYSSGG